MYSDCNHRNVFIRGSALTRRMVDVSVSQQNGFNFNLIIPSVVLKKH